MSVTKSDNKQAVAEAKRRQSEEDRRRKEEEYRKRHAEFKAKSAERTAAEKEIQAQRARSVALKMTTTETKSDYVLPPKAVAETDMNWTGKLDQKMINLSGTKKEKLLALTTGDGKTVVLSKTSVVEFSLAGMDLSLSVGKELSVRGKTSVRKTADGTVYLVSKIATATLKSSAIYDDLME